MENEKPDLVVLKTASSENFLKPHLSLKSKYMDPLLCEVSQKVKSYNYDTTRVKVYLVAYPDSIRINMNNNSSDVESKLQ